MSNEKLDVINSMKVVEVDASGGELIYAIVDYNEENLQKISQVVPNVEEYLKNVGDPDGTKESIDISVAAFQYAGADCYAKGKFRNDENDYKLNELEALEAEKDRYKRALQQILEDEAPQCEGHETIAFKLAREALGYSVEEIWGED